MKTVVLTDGDPIVYRCGFAAQQTVIHGVADGPDGVFRIRFEGKWDRNRWLEEHKEHELLEEESEVIAEPLPFCLQTVKQVLDAVAMRGAVKLFLTSTEKGVNFREKIATIVPYKNNRKDAKRPIHYQAIRDYLVNYHGAVVIEGREADDEISIQASRMRAAGRPHVVASIDKDLDQIPGRHYDYARHVEYTVGKEYAQKWFWIQTLAGDPTDSVPGCWKVGKGKAEQMVDEWYLEGLSQEAIWEAVVEQYQNSLARKNCPYASSTATAVALETARLVYMQCEVGELWMPPPNVHGRLSGVSDE